MAPEASGDFNAMFGEQDMHAETESEDGGVALLMGESSDEMETSHESAPTSPSQSPINLSSSLLDIAALGPQPFEEGTPTSHPTEIQPMESEYFHEALMPLSSSSDLQENGTHALTSASVSLSQASFAQALSEELLGVPAVSATLEDEDVTNPYGAALDTPQTFPTSTPTQPQQSAVPVGSSIPLASIGELSQSSGQQMSEDYADLATSIHEDDLEFSSPTLTDVFGSGFHAHSMLPSQAQTPSGIIWIDLQEDYDALEAYDNVKNLRCDDFFNYWKQNYAHGTPGYPPISHLANNLKKVPRRDKVLAKDTDPKKADPPDLQGIHWSRFQTTKEEAREVRRMTYSNHTNKTEEATYADPSVTNLGAFGSQAFKVRFSEKTIPSIDRHFDFRETNMKFRSYITHFQLRHTLFASSKNALFYIRRPSRGYGYGFHGAWLDNGVVIEAKISCFNPETSADERAMDLTRRIDNRDGPDVQAFRPYTLNAANGVLTVGSFEGKYAMKSLSATFEAKPTIGTIVRADPEGSSTNHIQSFLDRQSGLPQVAFSSNDKTIRILDCTTNKFVRTHRFPYAVNSSAISPDGRMRLLVGDDCLPIVANAETGEEITKLRGHTNFGFACDWAPDGVTMATGHQDGFVRVWDARKLSQSTHAIPMEMAGSRTLQFSPLGTGKRVLVIAETGDFVHVVDAQTFESKQVIEFFGEIAGITMAPDGSALYIANQDSRYGGLMEFERSWSSPANEYRPPKLMPVPGNDDAQWDGMNKISNIDDVSSPKSRRKRPALAKQWLDSNTWKIHHDWLPDSDLDDDPRARVSWAQRKWQGSGFSDLTT